MVDVGSHTLKAGLPYNFPSFDDPTVVRYYLQTHAWTYDDHPCIAIPATVLLQVTPSYVMPVADPGLASSGNKGAALQPVINRGLVADWEGLEALLHGVLYGEVLVNGSTCRHACHQNDRQASKWSLIPVAAHAAGLGGRRGRLPADVGATVPAKGAAAPAQLPGSSLLSMRILCAVPARSTNAITCCPGACCTRMTCPGCRPSTCVHIKQRVPRRWRQGMS